MVDVTKEGMNARDDKRVLTTKKLTYYDKERNSKVYRSAYRFNRIGDTDRPRHHIMYGRVIFGAAMPSVETNMMHNPLKPAVHARLRDLFGE